MADIQVPSIATATPAAADTVVGVQGGAVKRMSVGNLAKVGSFTQAGTGAVARTVEAKLRDTVSVKDFGAVGDGTTDDTAAIQAALDAATNKWTVWFPSGSYKITSELLVPSNTTIRGNGRNYGTQIIPTGCRAFVIDGSGPKGSEGWVFRIRISDLLIAAGSAVGDHVIYINAAYNVGVENVQVAASPTTVANDLYVSGCNDAVLEDVVIRRVAAGASTVSGIKIDGTSAAVSAKIISPDVEGVNRALRVVGDATVDVISPYTERCVVAYSHETTGGIVNIFGGVLKSLNGFVVNVGGDNLFVHGTDLSPYTGAARGGQGIECAATTARRNVRFIGIPRTADAGFLPLATNRLSVEVLPAPIVGHYRKTIDFAKVLVDNTATELFRVKNFDTYAKVRLDLHGYVGSASVVQVHEFTVLATTTLSTVNTTEVINTSAGNWVVSLSLSVTTDGSGAIVSATADTSGALGEGQAFNLYGKIEIEGVESGVGGVYLS